MNLETKIYRYADIRTHHPAAARQRPAAPKPDKGFTLFDRKSHRTFPTADIYADDLPNWSAVAVDAA